MFDQEQDDHFFCFPSSSSGNMSSSVPSNSMQDAESYMPQCLLSPSAPSEQFFAGNLTSTTAQSLVPDSVPIGQRFYPSNHHPDATSNIESQLTCASESDNIVKAWIENNGYVEFDSGYATENASYAPSHDAHGFSGSEVKSELPESRNGVEHGFTSLLFFNDSSVVERPPQQKSGPEEEIVRYATLLPDQLEALARIAQILRDGKVCSNFYQKLAKHGIVIEKLMFVIERLKYTDGGDLLYAISILYHLVQHNKECITPLTPCFRALVEIFQLSRCHQTLAESARLLVSMSETTDTKLEISLLSAGLLEAVTHRIREQGFDLSGIFLAILKNLSHHLRHRTDLLLHIFPRMKEVLLLVAKNDLGGKDAMRCFEVISNCIVKDSEESRNNKKALDKSGTISAMVVFLDYWCNKFPDHSSQKQYFDVMNKVLYCLRRLARNPEEIWFIKMRKEMAGYPEIMQVLGRFLAYTGTEWKFVRFNSLDLVRSLSRGLVLGALMRASGIIEKLAAVVSEAHTCVRAGIIQGTVVMWSDCKVSWYLKCAVQTLCELAETPNNRNKMLEIGFGRLIDTVMMSEVGQSDAELYADCARLKHAMQTYGNPISASVLSPSAQLRSNLNELSLGSPVLVRRGENVPPNSPNVRKNGAESPMVEGSDDSDTERSRIINSVLDLQEEMLTSE